MSEELLQERRRRWAFGLVALAAFWPAVAASASPAPVPSAPAAAAWLTVSKVEVVSTGKPAPETSNSWGGHQPKIVRNDDGVFIIDLALNAPDKYRQSWRVKHREANGTWRQVASGPAGREPAVMVGLTGNQLAVFAFPGGKATLWTGRYNGTRLPLTRENVPGFDVDNWPYASAGVDRSGRLCVMSNNENANRSSIYNQWTCRANPAAGSAWITGQFTTPHRYSYNYLMPTATAVNVVGTRAAPWADLGIPEPPASSEWAFNAIGAFRAPSFGANFTRIDFAESPWSPVQPYPKMIGQLDGYTDTSGRIHTIYEYQGPIDSGRWMIRHRVVSATGTLIADVEAPDLGYPRVWQDARRNYYLITSDGYVQRLAGDGYTLMGAPATFFLGGYDANGRMYITSPRTGTAASQTVDIMFVNANDDRVLYMSLTVA